MAGSKKWRPSLLLITLDTTRADHLGCYGASFAQTPNLDALAKSGTLFKRVFSPVPLTLPSHTSMLTGLVPRRHKVRDNALFRLDRSVPIVTENLHKAGYYTAAYISSVVLDRITGLDRGFDLYEDSVRMGERSFFNYEERAASQVTDAALRNMWQLEPPFFLWVHYFDPHLPYVPPKPFSARFRNQLYDGEIAFMDQEIGRLLTAVRSKAEKLVVVVAGDHGESLKEHGEAGHGIFIYESTQWVPLIMEGYGIPVDNIIHRNVGLVDLAPTILDLLSLPPMKGIDGQSILPLLQGKELDAPDYELETFYPNFAYGWSPLRGLIHGGWKYIEAPRPEFYDLRSDPSEKKDLSMKRKAETAKLAKILEELVAGDEWAPSIIDEEMREQRRRLESLGYLSGSGTGEKLSTIDPKDGIRWIGDLDKANRELQKGNPKEGIPLLSKLLERNPDNMQALIMLALCYQASGDIGKGIKLLHQVVADNPDSDLAHYNLANALAEKWYEDEDTEFLKEAKEEYERVLELNPRHADAYINYAALLAANKQDDKAYHLYQQARQKGIADPDIETKIGFMEMKRRAPSLAREAFRRAVALNPLAIRAIEGLGQVAYAEGRFHLAADFYARALRISPSAGLAKTLGSILLHDLNDVQGAQEAYQKALGLLMPEDPDREAIKDILESLDKMIDGSPDKEQ